MIFLQIKIDFGQPVFSFETTAPILLKSLLDSENV